MLRRSLLPILMAAALTACAPGATAPSINPTDIGATALALANSILTETPSFGGNSQPPAYVGATDSALGTPIPVTGLSGATMTDTPVPVIGLSSATDSTLGTPVPVTGLSGATATDTPVPVTGLSGAIATGTAGPVDCNHPLNVGAAGKAVRVAVKNISSGAISLTMGLASPNSLGRCGWVSLLVPKHSKAVLQVPESRLDLGDVCYWATAVITDRGSQASVAGKDFCIVSGGHWVLNVSDTGISLSAQ